MAVDYIIASVLILSAIINALALGAFWVTPSLRTTANRFVINLLIVNLVGCAVLIPSLFVCGNSTDTVTTKSIIEKIITKNVESVQLNTTVDGRNYSSLIIEKENETDILIQEIDENKVAGVPKTRCWGFDLATALGKFERKNSDFIFESGKFYFLRQQTCTTLTIH